MPNLGDKIKNVFSGDKDKERESNVGAAPLGAGATATEGYATRSATRDAETAYTGGNTGVAGSGLNTESGNVAQGQSEVLGQEYYTKVRLRCLDLGSGMDGQCRSTPEPGSGRAASWTMRPR